MQGCTALRSLLNASNEAPLAQMAQMSLMPVPDFSTSAVPGRLDGRHGRRLGIGEFRRRQAAENRHLSALVEVGCADGPALGWDTSAASFRAKGTGCSSSLPVICPEWGPPYPPFPDLPV